MDPFDFAGLKPNDVLKVRFGNDKRLAMVTATYVTDQNVPPSHVRVSIDGNEYLIPSDRVLQFNVDAFDIHSLPKP